MKLLGPGAHHFACLVPASYMCHGHWDLSLSHVPIRGRNDTPQAAQRRLRGRARGLTFGPEPSCFTQIRNRLISVSAIAIAAYARSEFAF